MACGVGADLVLRLQRDAALGMGAVVDPRRMAVRGQTDVGHQRLEALPVQGSGAVVPSPFLKLDAFITEAPHREQELGIGHGLPIVPKCPVHV